MLRVFRQVVNQEEFASGQFNSTNEIVIPTVFVDSNMNSTNGSSLLISAYSSSSNKQGFSWKYSWNLVILLVVGLLFVTILLSLWIWSWCNRVYRLRRQHSLPLAVDDFIETTKIQEKRLSSSPIRNKAPPVPPRPTAYTTTLGKVEYRSNL